MEAAKVLTCTFSKPRRIETRVASDAPENPALCLQTTIDMSDTGMKGNNAGMQKVLIAQFAHTSLATASPLKVRLMMF